MTYFYAIFKNTTSVFFVASLSLTSANAQTTTTRITPFSKVEKHSTTGNKIPINTYTRLAIDSSSNDGTKIGYAKRNLIFRFAIGKKYTANVLLNSEAGKFKATTPLITREYNSSSKTGEGFVREISYDTYDFPLFLVNSDSRSRVGSFSLSVDVNEATDSNVASLSLDVVSKALKAVAPSSGVVTTLTKESSDSVADTLDQTANQLFATSVKEKTSFDIELETGTRYILSVFGPRYETDELNSNELIGQWTISFAPPQPSIFSDVICSQNTSESCSNSVVGGKTPQELAFDQASAHPSNVLAFELVDKVGELGTVSSYLKQQDWWADAITSLGAANPPSARFCRQIRNSIAELGLNDLDGRIVANAVANSGLVSSAIKTRLLAEADCSFI